jgi:hypothetical protein
MIGSTAARMLQAGRSCPTDYIYSPAALARAADFDADTLYVAGGLYGNLAALDAVERLADAESDQTDIVFNGDYHWFDAEPEWFGAVERRVAPYRTLRGNVETEVARCEDVGAGCGCAYPDNVSEDLVRRSNDILAHLTAIAPAEARAQLRGLPMHLVAQVGSLRVGIVHGDAQTLAGWQFAQDALDDARKRSWLHAIRTASNIDVFASTHTCLAALRDFSFGKERMTVVNNGAAGMPNFAGTTFGVITRIANTPSPHKPLYGLQRDGVFIDALAVHYDRDDFFGRFMNCWPAGSPAHVSYCARIVDGPDYDMPRARPQ